MKKIAKIVNKGITAEYPPYLNAGVDRKNHNATGIKNKQDNFNIFLFSSLKKLNENNFLLKTTIQKVMNTHIYNIFKNLIKS